MLRLLKIIAVVPAHPELSARDLDQIGFYRIHIRRLRTRRCRRGRIDVPATTSAKQSRHISAAEPQSTDYEQCNQPDPAQNQRREESAFRRLRLDADVLTRI